MAFTTAKASTKHEAKLRSILALLMLFTFLLPAAAQENERFTVQFHNRPLKIILNETAAITGYEFAYSDTEIAGHRHLTVLARQQTAEELIRTIASIAGLEISFSGKKVLLKADKNHQFYSVSGLVVEENGSVPMAGVHIYIPCNSGGTFTDGEGRFALKVPWMCESVTISYMGMLSQEIGIRNDSSFIIRMKPEVQTLKETVVVAFGIEQEDLLTGAVSYLKTESGDKMNQGTFQAAIQSELPGLQLQPNGGTPGSAFNTTIRGISSINAGSRPLFVVDGIPVITGDYSQLDFSGQAIDALSTLNISDIESISVLKDAAASSLFGSNSSNGVILINTRRGKAGQNEIEFHSRLGFQQTTGKLDMLNAAQWMNLMNEHAAASGNPPVYTQQEIENNVINTDWQNEVLRTAPLWETGLSIRGGTEKARHYISGNIFNQDGIVIGSGLKQFNLRMNYDYQITDRLSIETGNSFSYSINQRIEGDQTLNGPLPNAISLSPVFPVFNSDGSYNNDGPYANPVSIARLEKNLAYTYRNTFHFKANYNINRYFTGRSLIGIDFYNLREQAFAPKTTRQGAKYNGLGIEATSHALRFYHTSYLDFEKSAGNRKFSATAGYSLESNGQHDTFLRAQNFAGSSFEFLQDAATPVATQSFETQSAAISIFTRLQQSFSGKYIFTLNLRSDGSSKFGKNNRFGFFPSASGLWYASREDFFRTGVVSSLIFSLSYGITGNDQIGDFLSLGLFSAGDNYNGEGGISPTQIANPDLKWESNSHLNFGSQIVIREKIRLRIDLYNKQTKDLLLQKPMPTSSGYAYIMSNIGRIENRGIELSASIPLKKGEFLWEVYFNLTANRNRVKELYENQPIRNIGRASSSIEVGEPVSFFYGFNVLGVNPDDGNLTYEDLNNDGKITDLDRKKTGSPHPDFFGGLGTNLQWKNFSMNILFSFSQGNEIFNSTRIYTETISLSNQTTAILRRWQKPGDITDVPKASVYNQRFSSRFVEDGSFIRLRNIRINYDLPLKMVSKARLSGAQLYVSGRNLLTFTRYSGMDPEINYNGLNHLALGTDFFTCPQPKNITLGICVNF